MVWSRPKIRVPAALGRVYAATAIAIHVPERGVVGRHTATDTAQITDINRDRYERNQLSAEGPRDVLFVPPGPSGPDG